MLREGDQATLPAEEVEAQFHALRRLVASKAGFACLTSLPGSVHMGDFVYTEYTDIIRVLAMVINLKVDGQII